MEVLLGLNSQKNFFCACGTSFPYLHLLPPEGEEAVEKYEYRNVTERGTSTLYIVEENKTSSI
jgi:hypothetical protein